MFGDFWILKLISNLGSIILDLGAYLQLLEWLNLGTYLQLLEWLNLGTYLQLLEWLNLWTYLQLRGGGGGGGRVWLEEISRRVSVKGFPEGFW